MRMRRLVSAVALFSALLAPAVASATQAEPARRGTGELEPALARLAERADRQQGMLYRIQCVEKLSRMVHRRRESAASFGYQPDQTLEARYGILIVRDESGAPREMRLKLKRGDRVRLDREGRPVEVTLPAEFAPLARAFPHAQVILFTAENQEYLDFRILPRGKSEPGRYRIDCADRDDLAVEFLAREAPRIYGPPSEPKCWGRASGQMCLSPDSGEVSAIVYYRVGPTEHGCAWDVENPFASIEQDVVEKSTGMRFPSRVETVYPLDWRDTAVFVQRFESCVFADVRVRESIGPSRADR